MNKEDVQGNCLRCGLMENHQRHHAERLPPEGWHPFRGQSYLDALEDALLFVREKNQPHEWEATGITLDNAPPFSEKRCKLCGAPNWGSSAEGSVCFGNGMAEKGVIAAHNRRASAQNGGCK